MENLNSPISHLHTGILPGASRNTGVYIQVREAVIMNEKTVNGLIATIKGYLKEQGIDRANVTITYATDKACASIEVLPEVDDKDRKLVD